MHDFFMLIATFSVLTFLISIIALFRPIAALWLPNQTRAIRVSLAAFLMFFLCAFLANRTEKGEPQTVDMTSLYLREMMLNLPDSSLPVMCNGFHEIFRQHAEWFSSHSEQRLAFLSVAMMVKLGEEQMGVSFDYTDDELSQSAMMFRERCGVPGENQ